MSSNTFDTYYKQFKSEKNKTLKKGSGNYWTLYALWLGNTIDDYSNRPTNDNEREIRNIKSRISDLRNNFGVDNIKSRVVEDERYKEYWLDV